MDEKKEAESIVYAGLPFKNPVLTTAGTCGYAYDLLPKSVLSSIGGVTLKALSPEPKSGNPHPRVCETEAGFLNTIGLQNQGLLHFVEHIHPNLHRIKSRVALNLVGDSIDDYVLLTEVLSALRHVDMLELNLSCPNAKQGEDTFDGSPSTVLELVKACKRACGGDKPIVVKLSPSGAQNKDVVRACEEAGAGGLSIANTFPAMKIDVRSRRSMLSRTMGGYSGSAVKPLVLHLVHRVSSWTSLPIIAMGGVRNGADVVEYLLAGATLVGVGTQTLIDPASPLRILRQYRRYLRRRGASTSELIGALRT